MKADDVDGEVINIRGVDYVAHNDELPIPDDEKGETKIDAEGRLQGGEHDCRVTAGRVLNTQVGNTKYSPSPPKAEITLNVYTA